MQQFINQMELASLNSGIAEAYMKEAEESLHMAVEKLEGCLHSFAQLRGYGSGARAMREKGDSKTNIARPGSTCRREKG